MAPKRARPMPSDGLLGQQDAGGPEKRPRTNRAGSSGNGSAASSSHNLTASQLENSGSNLPPQHSASSAQPTLAPPDSILAAPTPVVSAPTPQNHVPPNPAPQGFAGVFSQRNDPGPFGILLNRAVCEKERARGRVPSATEYYRRHIVNWRVRFRRKGHRSYYNMTRSTLLSDSDTMFAITSVSEAVKDLSGRNTYSLMPPWLLQAATMPELLGGNSDNRIARPRKPLIIPWFVTKANVHKSNEGASEGPSEEGIDLEKLEELDEQAHIILVVVDVGNDPNDSLGLPSLTIMDSASFSGWDVDNLMLDVPGQVKSGLKTLRWLEGPFGESSITSTLLDAMHLNNHPVAQQIGEKGNQPCGVHVILNAWAYCMGLHHRINVGCRLEGDVYKEALELIRMAIAGTCDFWLIYWWMMHAKFLHDLHDHNDPEQRHEISRAHRPGLRHVLTHPSFGGDHLWHHLRLMEDGAKFFDHTELIKDDDELVKAWNTVILVENIQCTDVQSKATELAEPSAPELPASESSLEERKSESEVPNVGGSLVNSIHSQLLALEYEEEVADPTKVKKSVLHHILTANYELAYLVKRRLKTFDPSKELPPPTKKKGPHKSFEDLALGLLGKKYVFHTAEESHMITQIMRDVMNDELILDVAMSEKTRNIDAALEERIRQIETGQDDDARFDSRVEDAEEDAEEDAVTEVSGNHGVIDGDVEGVQQDRTPPGQAQENENADQAFELSSQLGSLFEDPQDNDTL